MRVQSVIFITVMVLHAPISSGELIPGVRTPLDDALEGGGRILTEGGKVFGEVFNGIIRIPEGVIRAHGQVFDAAGKEVTIFGENAFREGNIALQSTGREFNLGINNVIREVNKGFEDVLWNAEKAGKDIEANVAKSGRDVEDAGQAIGKYVESSIHSQLDAVTEAAQRIQEGKFVDAVWHAALDPLNDTQKNAAIASTESSLINTVGQVAATAYGGPQGAAAYAAWLTYHQTGGNLNAAIQVGLITGITATAMQGVNNHMTINNYSVDQKALVMATIGGASIAAAGGSPDQIRDGFFTAGAMVYVQDHYQKRTQHELDEDTMKASKHEGKPYCTAGVSDKCIKVPESAILAKDKDGNPTKIDYSKADISVPATGQGGVGGLTGDQGQFMQGLSKIPGVQGMSVMHDNWVVDYGLNNYLGGYANQATIVPAILVYYLGTGAPFYEAQRKTVIESTIKNKVYADAGQKQQEPPPIQRTILQPNSDVVVDSYICGYDRAVHQMVVEEYDQPNPNICQVLHLNEYSQVSKVIWQAQREKKFCERKAFLLAQKMQNIGMTCMYQAGSKRLVPEKVADR
ncbi:hypothetical protein [Pseudomonas reinekei]